MTGVLLVGGGEIVSPHKLKILAQKTDFILAADSGADALLKANLMPDKVIGDLDSISDSVRRRIPSSGLLTKKGQNDTDLEKALHYVMQNTFTQCTLVGFIGKRWDFSLGNLLALSRFASKLELCVVQENCYFYILTQSRTFTAPLHTRVSLIPLKNCRGVFLKGLKYPLQNKPLRVGTTRSLSNETISKNFSISLDKGCLAVYVEDAKLPVFY